jgi:hemerythrin
VENASAFRIGARGPLKTMVSDGNLDVAGKDERQMLALPLSARPLTKAGAPMGLMQWDDSLSVGVELIDEQHKTWIQRFNDVSAAIEAMHGPQRIAEALGFLRDYTLFHFATEERSMAEHAYPEAEVHKTKHEELKHTLGDLESEYQEEGATHILADSIDTFMTNWLVTHIREVDMKFGAFLKDKR